MADNTPISPTPGFQTSQGQLTAIFTLICLVLGVFGIVKTPAQLDSWAATANHLVEVALPIITALISTVYYIISRGKIQSNAINANATVQAAALAPAPIIPTTELVQGQTAQFAGGLGLDMKKPETYQELLHIAGELGVPGAHQADAISQKLPVADLLTGILSIFHKKTKALPVPPA